MKVCIPTDEVDLNPFNALKLIASLGLKHIELRGIFGDRLPDGEPRQIEKLIADIRSAGFEVAALSPGLFKVPHTSEEMIRKHLDKRLPDSIDLALKLETSKIIVFGFVGDPTKPWDRMRLVNLLNSAARKAEDSGCVLVLENEPICLIDTAVSAASVIKEVNMDSLKANWDPCNAKTRGEDAVPTGFDAIQPYIVHVHLKDFRLGVEHKRILRVGDLSIEDDRSKDYVPLGEGIVGIPQVLAALVKTRYDQFISLETHIRDREYGARASVAAAKKLMMQLRIPFE